MGRTIIIGLDGVPFEQIQHLTRKGVMPHTRQLIQQGNIYPMQSSIPEVSNVSWSNMITGCNPGQHGIYGFNEMIPNTYTQRFPTYTNLSCPPFWKYYNNKKYVILNVPATYPAMPLNGLLVSGFVSIDLQKAVYPSTIFSLLQKIGYMVDVDISLFKESKTLFLKKLNEILEKRLVLIQKTWNKILWDLFMVVFTGTDRINHMMWDVYENNEAEFYDDVMGYYGNVDCCIGWIMDQANQDDQIIMLSDHGMGRINHVVNINNLLETYDYLKTDYKKQRTIRSGTKAFCLEPSRIYINKDKVYPKGCVDLRDVYSIRNNLFDMFSELSYCGKKVIKKVYVKEEVYHGPLTIYAPDLVLIPSNGFALRGGFNGTQMFTNPDNIKGMHTQDNAFLVLNNGEYTLSSYPHIHQVIQLFKKRLTDETNIS